MPTPVENLSEHDYKLIEYISQFQTVSKDKIEEFFNGQIESIALRLSMLSQPSYANRNFDVKCSGYIIEEFIISKDPHSGTSFPITKNQFYISPYGKKVLQDYLTKRKKDKSDIWLKNAWIPIIVAFITTLLTNYILPLLPQMLKWLSCIFSKKQ